MATSDEAGKLSERPNAAFDITPAMIGAGVSVLVTADYRIESHANVVTDILIAALEAVDRDWKLTSVLSSDELNIV